VERTDEVRVSFDDFYRQSWPDAVRLAHLLTGGSEAAEDLAQDAFTRVHRQWHRVEHPPAYLHTAIVNRCRSWHRARRSEDERLSRLASCGPPEHDLHDFELRDAIRALPYRQRAVIVLRYYAGLSEREIAQALGCRPGTVKSLASRAFERLRTIER